MARRRGGGKVIDFKTWALIPASSASITTNTTTSGNGLTSSQTSTILRCRGYVQGMLDATKQVGDQMILTFGLGLISSDAFAVGATAFPDPDGDGSYPWLWWGQMTLRSELAAGAESWGTSAQRLEVDTKAMRRFNADKTLVWVVQSTSAAGAPATNINIGTTRVLIGS